MNRGDHMTDRERVEAYAPMVKFIAGFSGARCEVVLHDLSDIEHSIIAIENGHVSGRKVGDGLMDFAYQKFVEDTEDVFIVNQSGRTTKDHKVLRLSAYRIRRPADGEIIGLLCVTVDITELIHLRRVIDADLYIDGEPYKDSESPVGPFALPLAETLEAAFRNALQETGCVGVEGMTKEDKLRVIAVLKENHLFEIKGAVNFIAKKINISEPSVYRYLKEVKNNDGE